MTDVPSVFDGWARSGRSESMEQGHSETAAPVLQLLPFVAGGRFLDVGCGNAWASAYAVSRGMQADAIDVSPEMVAKANAREGVMGHCLDAAKLPFEDDSFDLAWSMEALYYSTTPDEVLTEIRRVLKPGGTLMVLLDRYTENPASHGWDEMLGLPMILRSEAEWVEALRTAGFQEAFAFRAKAVEGEDWKMEQGTLCLSGLA